MTLHDLAAKATIRIHGTPAEVFHAFADPIAMSRFWFTRRDDGLREGESVAWFVGAGEDAASFDVRVERLEHPNRIVIAWPNGSNHSQVTWSIAQMEEGDTLLSIEESGFTGSRDTIIQQALDSTGGFNQVIVAAKALIEHGVELNIVADHA